jgi:hypothetical protein
VRKGLAVTRTGQVVVGAALILIGFVWMLGRQRAPLDDLFGTGGAIGGVGVVAVWILLLAGAWLIARGLFTPASRPSERDAPDPPARDPRPGGS